MVNQKKQIGDSGEFLACNFLKNQGYLILETNYQKKIGEIDIIAKQKNTLHFIEVKTRTENSVARFGLPQEAVSFQKKKKLIISARFYLSEKGYLEDSKWQIDVIAIIVNKEKTKAKINFIENAVSYDNL